MKRIMRKYLIAIAPATMLLLSVRRVFADEVGFVEETLTYSFWPYLAGGVAVIAAVLLGRIIIKKRRKSGNNRS